MSYKAPVRDLLFSLAHAAQFDQLASAFPAADSATVSAVLEGAGALAADVLAPLNRSGDQHGARLEAGGVRAPGGFAKAYEQFASGGWNSLAAEPDVGGQGLPRALESAVFEMVQGANMAFGLCPMLTLGAVAAISANGDEAQKARFLPKLVSGEWTGTMNLTEPQAGSDLAAIATRAVPDDAGGYRLSGEKIFLTWGDHDLTENIVHLVLARLPDAHQGARGLARVVAP